jgi:hypothetical protein
MKFKSLWCFVFVLSGALFGCSTGSRPVTGKVDLAAYRIEQVPDKNGAPLAANDEREWQNFLVFSNSDIRVSLARSAMAKDEPQCGFDPDTLKLQWLKPGELLWISWTTLYQGSGGYTHDGNVILQIHNGQGRELFRDYIESVARAGWLAQDYSGLEIAYHDQDKTFTFTRLHTNIEGNMGAPDLRHPLPFTATFTNDDGKVGHISEVKTIDTWHYQLAGSKLKFLRGSSAVDVGDEAQPIEEIVKGFHVTRASLDVMNPRLGGQHTTTGIVVISENLKPYEVSSDDGLGGDKY